MPLPQIQQKPLSKQSDAKDHSLTKAPEPLRQRIWDHVSASPLHSLWDLQGVAPMVVVKRAFKSFNEDNLLSRAAELGYYFLFALFPTLVSASSILGLAAQSASDIYVKLLNYLALIVPQAALGIVLETFNQTTAHSSGGKITFGLAAAIWSASVGFTAIQDTLNTVYKVKETRAYWKVRGAAMAVTVLLTMIVTLTLAVLLGGDFGARYLEHHMTSPALGLAIAVIVRGASWVVAAGLLILLFAVIYYFAPDVKNKRWHWLTPGGAFGIAGWLLASIILRVYLHYFDNYSVTYGSLGAVIILLTWFYITGLMLLLGAEINSEIAAAVAEKKLTGTTPSGEGEVAHAARPPPDEQHVTIAAHSMNLYAAVLGLIVLTLLTVSLTRMGKVKTKADYLVAGRSLPAFVLVFTLLSSWIGSGSLLGGAENAYRHGFAALWQGGGGWAGLALIYFIAPRARKFAQFTIPDLLEARYNQTARVLGVIAVLFTYTAITSYQFIGGGDILHLIFPAAVTAVEGRYIIAGFVIVFTAIAGMSSVAYMDVAIGLLTTVTMLAALPVLIHQAGGWQAVHAALPATHFQILGDLSFIQAMELFLPTCLLMLGNQSMYQKFFSAKTEKDATRAVGGWVVGTVILESIIVAIAVVGSVLFPTGDVHDHPREILAYTGLHGFSGTSTLLGALLVGAIFAKIISTANNYLFSPATNLVNDLFVRYLKPDASNKQVLLVSRLMVAALGLWALYQALHTDSVLKKTLYAYTIYSAALTPVILAAFYWRRATASAAVASIATGTVVTVFWDSAFIHEHLPAILSERDAIFPALIASLLCLGLVSLLTPAPSEEKLRPFLQA